VSQGTKGKHSVLVVEGQPLMRQALAQLIDAELDLVAWGEAGTAVQALNFIAARKPDLVLTDLALPDKNGLELIKDLQVFQPGLPVLVFSMHEESLYAERVLRAGGRGYLMKLEPGKKVLEAVRQVLGGRIYLSDRMSARILESVSGHHAEQSASPLELLSDREFEIFQLIGQGQGTREIANYLHLSVKTVEAHRANMMKKLRVSNAAQLLKAAIEEGFIRVRRA
jgi:DNA-binding NarL/FixJ family response regulator